MCIIYKMTLIIRKIKFIVDIIYQYIIVCSGMLIITQYWSKGLKNNNTNSAYSDVVKQYGISYILNNIIFQSL